MDVLTACREAKASAVEMPQALTLKNPGEMWRMRIFSDVFGAGLVHARDGTDGTAWHAT